LKKKSALSSPLYRNSAFPTCNLSGGLIVYQIENLAPHLGEVWQERASMVTLCLLGDDGSVVQRWNIGDLPVTIGRDATADLVIPDDSLSRHHFTISRRGEHYVLKDLESQNGTSVDGRRAHEVQLHHNDCVAAGRTLFLFHEHPLPAAVDLRGEPPARDPAFLPAALTAERTAPRAAPSASSQPPG
jgi:hypothetical protein